MKRNKKQETTNSLVDHVHHKPHKKYSHKLQNSIYDLIIDYFGSWQSITVIFLMTTGLVTNGLLRHIPLADGYWVVTNLFYSVMAILEAEIILMGQKRKAEHDEARAEATYKLTKQSEKLIEHLVEEQEQRKKR